MGSVIWSKIIGGIMDYSELELSELENMVNTATGRELFDLTRWAFNKNGDKQIRVLRLCAERARIINQPLGSWEEAKRTVDGYDPEKIQWADEGVREMDSVFGFPCQSIRRLGNNGKVLEQSIALFNSKLNSVHVKNFIHKGEAVWG